EESKSHEKEETTKRTESAKEMSLLRFLPFLDLHHCCAVAEVIRLNIQLIQNREKQIRHGRVFRIPDVASTFQAAGSRGCKQNRQWSVIVLVGVAHSTAVQND